jgi:ketosteroid isomerase-like protein
MAHPNEEVIQKFFTAYVARDFPALRAVMTEDVQWSFPGDHPLSGIKKGVEEVVAFFDTMAKFHMQAEKYVTGVNDGYLVEAQRTWSTDDGVDIEMQWCVLWRFVNGRIAGGTHFSSDQHKADEFFRERVATLGIH